MPSWDLSEVQPGLPIKSSHIANASNDWKGDISANGNAIKDLGSAELREVAAPATPSDNKAVLYLDTSDGKLKIKKDSGSVVDLEAGGGGGSGDLLSTNNLSDLDDVGAARDNLGLGDSATKDVGTGSGDVAAGNHNHSGVYEPADANIQSHISSTSNPHSVTATQVGLGNVDNYATASQGEAEAGTATNKFMTPERTAQAIAALAPGGGGASTIDDLDDVTITTPNDGDVLTYDSGEWINAPATGGAEDLSDLGDVNLSSVSDGDLLSYDNASSKWINSAPPSGTLPTQTGHDGALLFTDGTDADWLDGLNWDGTTLTTTVPAQFLAETANTLGYTFTFKKRGTTGDATAAVANNTTLGYLQFLGWDGSAYTIAPSAYIACNSEEDFSSGHQGANITFGTTPLGSFIPVGRMSIRAGGNVLIGTGTDDGVNKLQVNGSVAAPRFKTPVTVTSFSTTPAFNVADASTFQITLEDDVSSSTLSNALTGQTITFKIIQDGTGGWEFAWPSNVLGGMTIDSSAEPNEIFTQQFHCFDGTNYEAISLGARR